MARQSLGAIRRQTASQAAAGAPGARPESVPVTESVPAPEPVRSSEPVRSPEAVPAPGSVRTPEVPAPPAPVVAPATEATPGSFPTREQLVQAWGDHVLAVLPARARARFRVGRFLSVEDGTALYALPNDTHRSYCEELRIEVQSALAAHFGVPVPIRLVVDTEPPADSAGDSPVETAERLEESRAFSPPERVSAAAATPRPSERFVTPSRAPESAPDAVRHTEDESDLLDPDFLANETLPAGDGPSITERLKQAFPGAEEV